MAFVTLIRASHTFHVSVTFLFILFFSFSSQLLQITAKTNQASKLIQNVCHRTIKQHRFCEKTLEADPEGAAATNILAIAKVAIKLAVKSANFTNHHIRELLSSNYTNSKWLSTLDSCRKSYEEVVTSFRSAQNELDDDFLTASYDSMIAGDEARECEQAMRRDRVRIKTVAARNRLTFCFSNIVDVVTSMLLNISSPSASPSASASLSPSASPSASLSPSASPSPSVSPFPSPSASASASPSSSPSASASPSPSPSASASPSECPTPSLSNSIGKNKTTSPLIKVVCKQTKYPHQYCMQTLESDPESLTATNILAIAKVALKLAVKSGDCTIDHITELLNNNNDTTSSNRTSALEWCIESYEGVVASFKSAQSELEKDFLTANYDSMIAGDEARECEKTMNKEGVRIESVSDRNRLIFRFSDIVDVVTSMLVRARARAPSPSPSPSKSKSSWRIPF